MIGPRPLVSIVTPVLNREGSIGRCLASVAGQTYSMIEHVLVDGGSTDGTLDVIRSFGGSDRLRWISEPDDGMYDAINKGLKMTRGDVVAYLNSDDLYLPWSVEVALRALRRGSDLVYGDLAILVMGKTRRRFFIQFYVRFDRKHYTFTSALGQPTVFWTRAMTDQLGLFDTSYKLIGDCEYWLRAAKSGMRLSHVEEILAVQLEHGETLRRRYPDLLDREWAKLRASYADWAGPARPSWRERPKTGLHWRAKQMRFVAAAQRHHPKSWSRFLAWIRGKGIDVPATGLLWCLLPARLRLTRHALLDAGSLERALDSLSEGLHAPP